MFQCSEQPGMGKSSRLLKFFSLLDLLGSLLHKPLTHLRQHCPLAAAIRQRPDTEKFMKVLSFLKALWETLKLPATNIRTWKPLSHTSFLQHDVAHGPLVPHGEVQAVTRRNAQV